MARAKGGNVKCPERGCMEKFNTARGANRHAQLKHGHTPSYTRERVAAEKKEAAPQKQADTFAKAVKKHSTKPVAIDDWRSLLDRLDEIEQTFAQIDMPVTATLRFDVGGVMVVAEYTSHQWSLNVTLVVPREG